MVCLDPNKTKVWNELVELFVDQFIFNTMIDVTLRDLETTKQGVGEHFRIHDKVEGKGIVDGQ